jgi:hypothetical protein
MIKQVFTSYTQKSRLFLFPLLGFPRNSTTNPLQTYISWEGIYAVSDMNLICEYPNRLDKDFKDFEKKMLNHIYFLDYKETENDSSVYIFDMNAYADAWGKFLTGKYSNFDVSHKKKIRYYFSNNATSSEYIDSYFSPERYYNQYSKILGVETSLLESVGELCSIPDLVQENLIIKIKDVEFSNFG